MNTLTYLTIGVMVSVACQMRQQADDPRRTPVSGVLAEAAFMGICSAIAYNMSLLGR